MAQSSPEYKDLSGLEGQDLLDAIAYNINLYKQAIADGVASEKADTETLSKLTAEYQLNMRINMNLSTPEIEKIVSPDKEKQLRSLSKLAIVKSLFAPKYQKTLTCMIICGVMF
ncbi:hypothetical protein [Leuconostoc mesenteroides]|uniref:hypothetical protein n=1 Tax=Leuconostoc mesenteroides TaxID=1245 RepID=UPI003EBC38B7